MNASAIIKAAQHAAIATILLDREADGGHWVTIDGAHVHIGKGGVIDKGPAHLKGKSHAEAAKGKKGKAPKSERQYVGKVTREQALNKYKADKAAGKKVSKPKHGSERGYLGDAPQKEFESFLDSEYEAKHGVIDEDDHEGIKAAKGKKSPKEGAVVTKASIQSRLIEHHQANGGDSIGNSDDGEYSSVASERNRTFLGKNHNDLPGEIRDHLQGRAHLRRMFNYTDDASKAGGADAMGEMGQEKYLGAIEAMGASKVTRAVAHAKKSNDPEMKFLAAVHENRGATPKGEKAVPLIHMPTSKLMPGHSFTINGDKFKVEEPDEGERVLTGPAHYPEVPLDAMEHLPIDKGSLKKSKAKRTMKADSFAPFSRAEVRAILLSQGNLFGGASHTGGQASLFGGKSASKAGSTDGRWVTVNGRHIFIKNGSTVHEAVKEAFGERPEVHGVTKSHIDRAEADHVAKGGKASEKPASKPEESKPVDPSRQFGLFAKDKSGAPVEVGEKIGQASLFNNLGGKAKAETPAADPDAKLRAKFDEKATGQMFGNDRDYGYGDMYAAPDGRVGTLHGSGGIGSDRVTLRDLDGKEIGKFGRDELKPVAKLKRQWEYDDRPEAKAASEDLRKTAKAVSDLRDKHAELLTKKSVSDRIKAGHAAGEISQADFDRLKASGNVLSDSEDSRAAIAQNAIEAAKAGVAKSSISKPAEALKPGQSAITRQQAMAMHGQRANLLPKPGETKPQFGDTTGQYHVGQTKDGQFFTEKREKSPADIANEKMAAEQDAHSAVLKSKLSRAGTMPLHEGIASLVAKDGNVEVGGDAIRGLAAKRSNAEVAQAYRWSQKHASPSVRRQVGDTLAGELRSRGVQPAAPLSLARAKALALAVATQPKETVTLSGALTFSDTTELSADLPDKHNDLTIHYKWVDAAKANQWFHPRTGQAVPINESRIDRWVDGIKLARQRGVDLPVCKDHKETADNSLGAIYDARRDGDRLSLLLGFYGDDSLTVAQKNKLSVGIDPNFKDSFGNRYGETIRHVAVTPVPVIHGQNGFLAASRN